MAKVLLTGATGFVGSFVTEELIKNGYEVFVTLRKGSSIKWIENLHYTPVYINLNNIDEIKEHLQSHNYDYIIHNAGLTRHPEEDELNRVNASILENFIKVINTLTKTPENFIFISSLAAYGSADQQKDGIVTRDSTPKPLTAYGRSKLKAEQLIKNAKFPYVILRPTAVYGPREKDLFTLFKTLNAGIDAKVGKGQNLSFIYVKDLSRVIVACLNKKLKYKSYFVSDSNLYSSEMFSELISKALSKKSIKITLPSAFVKMICKTNDIAGKLFGFHPLLNGDKFNEISAKSWNCYSEDLWQELALKPQYLLEEGVSETAEWYKAQGWL